MVLGQQQRAVQQETAQRLTEAGAQQVQMQQRIARVGDGMLMFQHKVEEMERQLAATGVPDDHEDLLDFEDLTNDGSSDTSEGTLYTHRLDHTVGEVKKQWSQVLSAMQAMAPPGEVTKAATAALTLTATHWNFSPAGAVAAVMNKCEERLPQIFGSTLLGALGKVLCGLWTSAPAAIWSHVKAKQRAAHDPSVLGRHDSDDMDAMGAAWAAHYRQRLQHGCQRRNRLIEQALCGTASEIDELFAEIDGTPQLGFSATAAGVADEAGDVWYGAQCYAAAYTEQVQRVLAGWAYNMRTTASDAQLSPATRTWQMISEVLGSRTP